MTEQTDAKIKKGLPPKRNRVCYQTLQDIVIPAGTILREFTKPGHVELPIALGKDFTGDFVVQVHADAVASGYFKPVVA